jgi:hypothetical protein
VSVVTSEASRAPLAARTVMWVATAVLASGVPATVSTWAGWSTGALVLPPVTVAVLLVAWATIGPDSTARLARPLLPVLAASVGGLWLISVVQSADGPQVWLASMPLAVQIAVANGLKVIPVALTAVAVVRQHPRRDDLALRVGDWRAASGLRIAGRDIGWHWLGALSIIVLCGGIVGTGTNSFSPDGIATALAWMPLCVATALLNSAAEEFQFRHAVRAFARPALGPTATIALTSVYFGLTHVNGTPSGVPGILLAGAFGLVLAIAIERTRGFCWNWTLHFVADTAIFFTIVASGPGG